MHDLLRRCRNLLSHPPLWWKDNEANREKLIADIDAALAEPAFTIDVIRADFERRYSGQLGITRLVTGEYFSPSIELEWNKFVRKYIQTPTEPDCTPPLRKPLTDDEVVALFNKLVKERHAWPERRYRDFARWVERAHGIGETNGD